jgi:hypothetical protein
MANALVEGEADALEGEDLVLDAGGHDHRQGQTAKESKAQSEEVRTLADF